MRLALTVSHTGRMRQLGLACSSADLKQTLKLQVAKSQRPRIRLHRTAVRCGARLARCHSFCLRLWSQARAGPRLRLLPVRGVGTAEPSCDRLDHSVCHVWWQRRHAVVCRSSVRQGCVADREGLRAPDKVSTPRSAGASRCSAHESLGRQVCCAAVSDRRIVFSTISH